VIGLGVNEWSSIIENPETEYPSCARICQLEYYSNDFEQRIIKEDRLYLRAKIVVAFFAHNSCWKNSVVIIARASRHYVTNIKGSLGGRRETPDALIRNRNT
jgi:hypothetical protein